MSSLVGELERSEAARKAADQDKMSMAAELGELRYRLNGSKTDGAANLSEVESLLSRERDKSCEIQTEQVFISKPLPPPQKKNEIGRAHD